MWPGIQTRMAEFLAANARYFQGIRTPIVIPINGADSPIDKSVHPTNQIEDWSAFDLHGNLPSTLPCSIELHIHNGPLGLGYTFFGWVTDLAGTWMRAQGSGPGSTTFAWTLQRVIG